MSRNLYEIAEDAPPGFAGWCGRCGRKIDAVTATTWAIEPGYYSTTDFHMHPCGCGPYPDPVDRSWWIYAPVYPPEWA